MGYSIFIISKDKKMQNKMCEFLGENMKSYNKHFFDSDDSFFVLRKGTIDISYTGDIVDPLAIGFDYNCSGGEREHAYSILKWMSSVISDGIAYFYDGELLMFKKEENIKRMEILMFDLSDVSFEQKLEFINADIKRLDSLWKQY